MGSIWFRLHSGVCRAILWLQTLHRIKKRTYAVNRQCRMVAIEEDLTDSDHAHHASLLIGWQRHYFSCQRLFAGILVWKLTGLSTKIKTISDFPSGQLLSTAAEVDAFPYCGSQTWQIRQGSEFPHLEYASNLMIRRTTAKDSSAELLAFQVRITEGPCGRNKQALKESHRS